MLAEHCEFETLHYELIRETESGRTKRCKIIAEIATGPGPRSYTEESKRDKTLLSRAKQLEKQQAALLHRKINAKNWTFRLLLVVILNSNYVNNVFEKTTFKLNKCYK